MRDIKAFFMFLFIFGSVHFQSSLLAGVISHRTLKTIRDAISPTPWELRKTRRIIREMGYPEYLNGKVPGFNLDELAVAVNDPAFALAISKRAGNHLERGEDGIRDWNIYEEFFYTIFNPRRKDQTDSFFDFLKKDVDDYVNAVEESQKTGITHPNFDFSEEVKTLKENRGTVVVQGWVNKTEFVREGLSEYPAQFNLVDFIAVVVSRFDQITGSVPAPDTPQLLRRYLSRVGGEESRISGGGTKVGGEESRIGGKETIDKKILAIFSSPSYHPVKGDTHDYLASRVLQNEEALNDAQVLLKIWRHPGTKRKETRAQLGKAVMEKKRSLNSEGDVLENTLFFEALSIASGESEEFSRFLNSLYN